MHNGAFVTLPAAVRHHLNAKESLLGYSGRALVRPARESLRNESEVLQAVLATLDTRMVNAPQLTDAEFDDLMAFLHALTSPQAVDLSHLVPEAVPSGLPVWD